MKAKISQLISAGALSMLASASLSFAADYTWTQGGSWGYWISGYKNGDTNDQKTSGWADNGTTLVGAPTYSDSFNYTGSGFLGVHIMGWDLANIQNGDSTLYANSITINTTSWASIVAIDGGDKYAWQFSNWKPVSISVEADFKVTASGFSLMNGGLAAGIEYLRIGGDFDLSGVSGTSAIGFSYQHSNTNDGGAAPNNPYTESNPSAVIGGVLKLGSSRLAFESGSVNQATGEHVNPVIQLGGLSGDGAYIINLDKNTDVSTYIFKAKAGETFTGGTFTGGLVDQWRTNGNSYNATTFTLIMDDTSNGGVQNIIISKSGTNNSEIGNANSAAAINVEIRNGKMGLGTTSSGDFFKTIEVKGGELRVAGDDHNIYTGDLVLNGGKIVFNAYGNNDSDIIWADSLSGDMSTEIFIDLSLDGFNVGDNLASYAFDVLGDSTNTSALNVSFTYAGIEQSFVWSWNDGTVVITNGIVVPEPATLAAILGALALAFAAFRRRR